MGGGYPEEELDLQDRNGRPQQQRNQQLDSSQREALLKGGEQVISVLQEMIALVSFCLLHLIGFFSTEGKNELFFDEPHILGYMRVSSSRVDSLYLVHSSWKTDMYLKNVCLIMLVFSG